MIISVNNSNLRKILIVLICFNLFVALFDIKIFGQNQIITMSDAVSYAQNLSKEYKNKKNNRATKKVQLQQAIEAVNDIRKKESTVRFSLLFNIKFPEKHALPKEIDLLMSVPKIEMEIKNIAKELEEIKLSDKEKTETCFIDVYGYEQNYKLSNKILSEMNEKLTKMKTGSLIGKPSDKDILSLKNKIKSQESKVSNLLQNFERNKEKLSELIGFDVSRGYIFKNPIKKVDIDRSYLDKLVDYTLNNDFNLYKAKNVENIARRNVNEIYEIYNKKWGSIVKKIESDIKKDSDIDFDQFIDKYNNLLNDIDKPWTGFYEINLLFFKIKIPKEWFKKEFDGLRYFDDQKYAIFIALKEKEDAINQRKMLEHKLKSDIKDGYEVLKELWKVYNTSAELSKLTQKSYDKLYEANKMGMASFDELEVERVNLEAAQETEFENLLAYNKQLIAYDKLTCGALTALKQDVDVFLQSAEMGDSLSEYEELIDGLDNINDKIIYYINNAVDQKRVVFGLQVPKNYPDKITHYEILTPEKVIIASRTEINKNVSVLPIEYKGDNRLFIRLYNNDQFIDEASFDAIVTRGQLDLKSNNRLDDSNLDESVIKQKVVIGSYDIIDFVSSSIKKIKINIPATQDISFYKIVDENNNEIGKQNKYYAITEAFSYLSFALNDLSKLKINLYDINYNLKFTAEFDESKNEIIY